MPTYDDRASKISLASGNIAPTLSQLYISALYDFLGFFTTDPAQTLEPATQKVATETTFFTRYILLAYAPTPRKVLASIYITGTAHIYVDYLAGVNYNYKYYGKLVKTLDFTNFTNITSESTLMSYTRANASTAGWLDDGTINGTIVGQTQLNEGEALLLAIRGTSWSSTSTNSSIGLKSANFKVYPLILQ